MIFSKINSYNLKKSWRQWPLLKAMSYKGKLPTTVLDCSLGLGNDASVMAVYGIQVTGLEIKTEQADLVQKKIIETKSQWPLINKNLTVINIDSYKFLTQYNNQMSPFEVIYLDPMFIQKNTKALPKKNAQWLQNNAHIDNSDRLTDILNLAINCAQHKTVVKRAKNSPHLANIKPHQQLFFKSNRFDIYLNTKKN